MANISTLITDVQQLLTTKGWFNETLANEFGRLVSVRLQEQFNTSQRTGTLRLSRLGPQCPCALWYSVHHPELAEKLPPWAEFKYSYGHIIEVWAITLAKAAGHSVTGEQDAVFLDGIEGHRDCIVDGCLVDVKSASSLGFLKFKNKTIAQDDSFGYLDQLDAYTVASLDDPLLEVKDKAYIWGVEKQLGHMVLYEHAVRPVHIRQRIEEYKRVISLDVPPRCSCETTADGKSGNIKLGVRASYSPFKYCCFPYLRTFLYANGPVYLTKVVRKPDVTEIGKDGRIIFS